MKIKIALYDTELTKEASVSKQKSSSNVHKLNREYEIEKEVKPNRYNSFVIQ